LTNTGNASITGLTYTFGGGAPAVFTRPNGNAGGTCGGTLAAGASCTINVRFAPVTAVGYTRSLSIAAPGATITGAPVNLTGTGSGAGVTFSSATTGTLTAGTLEFGNVGNTFSVITVKVGGAGPVTFGTSTVSGSNRYSLGNDTCSYLTVAANGTCKIRVNFNGTGNTGNNGATGALAVVDSGGAALTVPLTLHGR
jgi:hypothetical protein